LSAKVDNNGDLEFDGVKKSKLLSKEFDKMAKKMAWLLHPKR
jgi:hypothetical protein